MTEVGDRIAVICKEISDSKGNAKAQFVGFSNPDKKPLSARAVLNGVRERLRENNFKTKLLNERSQPGSQVEFSN
jgi:hypothetical protein